MSDSTSSSSSGIGFFGLLGIVFIVLKLTDCIDWSWWWVFAPIWMPAAAVFAVIIIVCVIFAVVMILWGR